MLFPLGNDFFDRFFIERFELGHQFNFLTLLSKNHIFGAALVVYCYLSFLSHEHLAFLEHLALLTLDIGFPEIKGQFGVVEVELG